MLKAALRELMKSGDLHRENAHNPERKIGARRINVPAIKVAGIYYHHGSSGASLKDAASGILMLRQPGRKPAAPVPVWEVAQFDIYYFIYNE
ncbi:hypothetical protein [Citrobacter braakii]|uniref:hypothetical protein n=1 Tax=Citrobacter braakii TaxID=57706 RepID=UPI0015E19727|nr:hypothetical protein [Citrobacter braakii]